MARIAASDPSQITFRSGDTQNARAQKLEVLRQSVVVLDAALVTLDAVADAAYTFAAEDHRHHKRFTSAAAVVATIPANADTEIQVGTRIRGSQAGAGQITLTPGAGVTLRSAGGALKSRVQYSVFEIEKIDTDEWQVSGDVTV